MCGGFVGEQLANIDPIFNANNPHERRQRLESEQIAQADRRVEINKQQDLADQTTGNQAVQAEAVATRRRKAAQSLLGAGGPSDETFDGSSTLARGRATGVRSVSTLG